MKSRFLIFTTLLLTVMCIGASNLMAQSATGTGVFPNPDGGAPTTVTVSAQQGGNGGIMRFGVGQTEVIAHPVDICVQGNSAFVVAEITHVSGDFIGAEGAFLQFGFQDNGKDGDAIVIAAPFFVVPFQIPACDLFNVPILAVPIGRGGWQVKP